MLPRIQPIRLRLLKEPFDDPDYIFELKHDGFRAIVYIENGECRLVSRNLKHLKFDSPKTVLSKLPVKNAIIDGEIVCIDEHGVSHFNKLLHLGADPIFYAFDLLWLNGNGCRHLPLIDRKEQLARLVESRHIPQLMYAQHIERYGKKLFEEVCRRDLEGLVAKRKLGTYKDSGRNWLKIKNARYSRAEGRHELLTRANGERARTRLPRQKLAERSFVAFCDCMRKHLRSMSKPRSFHAPPANHSIALSLFNQEKEKLMHWFRKEILVFAALLAGLGLAATPPAAAQEKKPNIVAIMGDDIGMWNIGAYHRGLLAGRTPNLDKLAKEGMLFTDYYAEASCTAGRANFITGQLPIRTGMTTVGQAGASIGLPAEAVTIATILKSMGYATGQFGKNHLGDKNEFLPCVHGFDEFFGYLYHLDAMEDPAHPNYPQNLLNVVGPRNMVHCWASDKDDPTDMPRWGKIGKQKIEDAGPLYPKRMETVDDEIRDLSIKFIDKAKSDNKPFFVWLNPTRMHIVTHLSPKYEALRNSENGWSEEEAGMAQLDDDVGIVMDKLKAIGEDENTIVVFTTDNGTEVFTWPDGGQTPFAQSKGTVLEGGFRVPCILRWPGHVPADSVQNGIFSGMDWLPTFVAAAGNPNITEELLKGKTIGDRTYKNHLDGYNQMAAITGKGPSVRHEIFYLGESTVGAVRIDDYKFRFIDQPQGWLGEKTHPDVPYITNLRLDPFERTGWPSNGTKEGAQQYFDWFKYQFWRFVFVQQLVAKEIQTFLDYPPMQRGASFNLDAVKAEMGKRMAEAAAASKGPSN